MKNDLFESNLKFLENHKHDKKMRVYRSLSFDSRKEARQFVQDVIDHTITDVGDHWACVDNASIDDDETQNEGHHFVMVSGEIPTRNIQIRKTKEMWKHYPEECEIAFRGKVKILDADIQEF